MGQGEDGMIGIGDGEGADANERYSLLERCGGQVRALRVNDGDFVCLVVRLRSS